MTKIDVQVLVGGVVALQVALLAVATPAWAGTVGSPSPSAPPWPSTRSGPPSPSAQSAPPSASASVLSPDAGASGSTSPSAATSHRVVPPDPEPSLAVKRAPCESVPADLVRHILSRPEVYGSDRPTYRPVDAAGWHQRDQSVDLWFVVVKFGVDVGDQPGQRIGVWVMKTLSPGDDILAVDPVAQATTTWGDQDQDGSVHARVFGSGMSGQPMGLEYCLTPPPYRGPAAANGRMPAADDTAAGTSAPRRWKAVAGTTASLAVVAVLIGLAWRPRRR